MQKLLQIVLIIFIALSGLQVIAQRPPKIYLKPIVTSMFIYIGGGSNNPGGRRKDQSHITGEPCLFVAVYKPIIRKQKFTLGINAGGNYGFSNKDPLTTLPNSFDVANKTATSVTSSGKVKQQSFELGAGPQANFYLGKHFTFSPIIQVGYMSLTQNQFSAVQTTSYNGSTYNYSLLSQTKTKTSGLALTPQIKIQYFFNNLIGLYIGTNYTMGPTIKNTVSTFTPEGNANANGQYTITQMNNGTNNSQLRETKYNAVGVHIGLIAAGPPWRVISRPTWSMDK